MNYFNYINTLERKRNEQFSNNKKYYVFFQYLQPNINYLLVYANYLIIYLDITTTM